MCRTVSFSVDFLKKMSGRFDFSGRKLDWVEGRTSVNLKEEVREVQDKLSATGEERLGVLGMHDFIYCPL